MSPHFELSLNICQIPDFIYQTHKHSPNLDVSRIIPVKESAKMDTCEGSIEFKWTHIVDFNEWRNKYHLRNCTSPHSFGLIGFRGQVIISPH